MSRSIPEYPPRPVEAMDPRITSIQPGGGVIIRLEQAWGRLRRCWLRTFRKGYVERMRACRQGDYNPCPHDVLDPRDLKFYVNQGGWHWRPEDDPFCGRDQWPFARVGLAELIVFSSLTLLPAAILAVILSSVTVPSPWNVFGWIKAAGLAVVGGLIVWFFRNPRREIPTGPGVVVSPADGVISSIDELPHDEFIGGPAVQIGIFLSVFNVHINRVSLPARVVGLTYRHGKFLNALRPESARENEQLAIRFQSTDAPHRPFIIRQIAGAIARRIVCWLKPGDELTAGAQFGMIKLGSRTELVIPREPGLTITVKLGDKVKAGSTVFARYDD